jgi:hypothetical protein
MLLISCNNRLKLKTPLFPENKPFSRPTPSSSPPSAAALNFNPHPKTALVDEKKEELAAHPNMKPKITPIIKPMPMGRIPNSIIAPWMTMPPYCVTSPPSPFKLKPKNPK